MERFDEDPSEGALVKRCPKCGKLTLSQAEHNIKCTSCGYEVNLSNM